jgi:hypothetical protein
MYFYCAKHAKLSPVCSTITVLCCCFRCNLSAVQVPADQLLLADAVRICVHEQLHDLAGDNERLRLAAAGSREAAARAEDEASRLQRENARLAAAVVSSSPLWLMHCCAVCAGIKSNSLPVG